MYKIQKPVLGTTVNWSHPLTNGLVGCWLMNEYTGSKINDLSGYNLNGAFVATAYPTWTNSLTGRVLDFTNSAVTIGDAIYNRCTDECTFVCRFKRRSYLSYSRLIDKYPGPSFYLRLTSPYTFYFYGTIGGTSREAAWNTFAPILGQWYTIAAVLGQGYQHLYVDGRLFQTSIYGGPYSGVYSAGTGVAAYVGNRASDLNRPLDGNIEFMYIFKRALSSPEAQLITRDPYVMFDVSQFWRKGF